MKIYVHGGKKYHKDITRSVIEWCLDFFNLPEKMKISVELIGRRKDIDCWGECEEGTSTNITSRLFMTRHSEILWQPSLTNWYTLISGKLVSGKVTERRKQKCFSTFLPTRFGERLNYDGLCILFYYG